METEEEHEAIASNPNDHGSNQRSCLEQAIANRLGGLPNYFRPAAPHPQIIANLWRLLQFAYLDNPLPSLFKERLFVYLSRFCQTRYCVARHVGFLVGSGRPAGDGECPPQTVQAALPLLTRPLARGEAFAALLEGGQDLEFPLRSFPAPDSPAEQALFACAAHVFLRTPEAAKAHAALRTALVPVDLEHLNVLLSFARTLHHWTRLNPGLAIDDDVAELLNSHPALAAAIFNDPEAGAMGLSGNPAAEPEPLPHLYQKGDRVGEQIGGDRETMFRDLVSALPAAVFAVDAEARLTYHNQRAAELWGRDPQPHEPLWSLLDWRSLSRPDGTPLRAEEDPVRCVLASKSPASNQKLLFVRPGQAHLDLLVNVAPLRDPAGGKRGAVCMVQDISGVPQGEQDREQLVHELERSNQELARFSYAVSHDLQFPVRSVRALTQLLIRRNEGRPDDAAHLATLIEQTAARMEHLIESLLDYAQAGHGELKRQTVSIDKVIDSVRVSLASLIAGGARISCSSLPTVEGDPVLLEQLFQNLIANAIKYRRPGHPAVIEIEGAAIPDGWRFAVKDNGQGIEQEHQSKIFEPLKRLHGNETPGSGMGLALCRTIVARHGGRIWVESEGVGTGATFYFTLGANSAG